MSDSALELLILAEKFEKMAQTAPAGPTPSTPEELAHMSEHDRKIVQELDKSRAIVMDGLQKMKGNPQEEQKLNQVMQMFDAIIARFQKKASLNSEAEDKKKKLDPKAKVRNRGTVCVPASSAKDKKDHFPINDEGQARNALARVHQYSSVPSWYSGSLKGLQALVSRKVHSKYPSIGKEKSSKKSSLESVDSLLTKYGD